MDLFLPVNVSSQIYRMNARNREEKEGIHGVSKTIKIVRSLVTPPIMVRMDEVSGNKVDLGQMIQYDTMFCNIVFVSLTCS